MDGKTGTGLTNIVIKMWKNTGKVNYWLQLYTHYNRNATTVFFLQLGELSIMPHISVLSSSNAEQMFWAITETHVIASAIFVLKKSKHGPIWNRTSMSSFAMSNKVCRLIWREKGRGIHKDWSKYLLITIIANNSDFQSNTSSLRGKRNLLIVQKLYCTRIITKEAKIMDLGEKSHRVWEQTYHTNKSNQVQQPWFLVQHKQPLDKRNLLTVQELYCTRIIMKETKIYLGKSEKVFGNKHIIQINAAKLSSICTYLQLRSASK